MKYKKYNTVDSRFMDFEAVPAKPEIPAPPYRVILADPPWHFNNYSADNPGELREDGRGANKHYATMSLEDIKRLPVADIAARDSVLLIWGVWALLPECLQVIEAWGFKFKTLAWIWLKMNKSGIGIFRGLGYWTRQNSEYCLLATRGQAVKRVDKGVGAFILSPLGDHSVKPNAQYDKIDRLFGDVSKAELFARRRPPADNWSVWGNESAYDFVLTGQEKDNQ